jgi:hypothetical protein
MKTPANSTRKRTVSALLIGFLAGFTWARLTVLETVATRRARAQSFIRSVLKETAE